MAKCVKNAVRSATMGLTAARLYLLLMALAFEDKGAPTAAAADDDDDDGAVTAQAPPEEVE